MIIQQSTLATWQIEDKSVQAVITSPPYYALRRYQIPDVIIGGNKDCQHEWGNKKITLKHKSNETNPGKEAYFKDKGASDDTGYQFCIHCNAWQGQYGLEPTPQLYIEHTRLWAKEAWRVLKKDGVFFLNLSDSYAGSNCGSNDYRGRKQDEKYQGQKVGKQKGYPSKCQLLIPHRVAIALIDDGWILRNTIIWYSTNKMPESVTDRFSKKYEYVFMFVKQERYYFDLNSVREPHKEVSIRRVDTALRNREKGGEVENEIKGDPANSPNPYNKNNGIGSMQPNQFKGGDYMVAELNPLGKNPGDVWNCEDNSGANTGENNKEPYKGNNPHRMRLTKHELATERKGSYQDPLHTKAYNPLGKNCGDVCSIPTAPSPEKH